ncbi:MAG: 3-deoxy-D-manno-octulosonic acid transferase [Alphaproteobacteria bacterium]
MTPRAYRGLTRLAGPLIGLYLTRRKAAGKEDSVRFPERLGRPGRARPCGPLVWTHAASVGEATSSLPLVERVLAARPDAHVLMTTGTVTSARLLAARLPVRAFHQYVPVDRPAAVCRFLDHWRPDLALWVEQELWPNLLNETQARAVPMVLVNGRMSLASFARWRRFPGLVRPLVKGFALCLAQSEADARRFATLGAGDVRSLGNLKAAAPALAADAQELARLEGATRGRPLWLAASTHAPEEVMAGRVHQRLKAQHPGLLTIVVPRHPARGQEVAAELRRASLAVALRSNGADIEPETDVYLGDTMGELGLFYRFGEVVFVGGSLIPHGGQNPIEPARLDCALVYGPHMFNFADFVAAFDASDAAEMVADEDSLAGAVGRLLTDTELRARRVEAARSVAEAQKEVLDRVFAALAPYLRALPTRERGRASA